MTQEEIDKRRAFVAKNPFEDAYRKGYLPPAAAVDQNIEKDNNYFYYVVSYSREDSKYVLPEIYDLQAAGFEIWYDHGIVDRVTQDNDWRKVVRDRISDFHCRGVLFYVSENFVLSPSIEEEVRMVKEANKPHLEIALPMTKYGHENEFCQAWKIATIAREVKSDIALNKRGPNKKRVELYKEMFNDSINFIKYPAPMEERYNGLKGMKIPELFEFRKKDDRTAVLSAVNDIRVAEIVVPSVAMLDGSEYIVVEIGNCALANCRYLRSVVLPETVKDIGSYAFYNCRSLNSIELPSILENISDYAFAGCSSLSEIKLPKFVQYIGVAAFADSGLTGMDIPPLVPMIASRTFANCRKLRFVDFHNEHSFYSDSFHYRAIGEYAFGNCVSLEHIELGNHIESIASGAFEMCRSLENFDIPEKVEEIADRSFYGTGLKSVNIGPKISKIGREAFCKCKKLETVILSDGVRSIDYGAFGHCDSLKTVCLDKNLESIGKAAFEACGALNSVVIPDKVIKIKNAAFADCLSLKEAVIGSAVEFIGSDVFLRCPLANIEFAGDVEKCVYYVNDKINYDSEDERESIKNFICRNSNEEGFDLDISDKEAVKAVFAKGYKLNLIYK